jgi:16S rRNA C967 or C1407 C5-methylase (RsmB/RsmF family)
LEVDSSVYDDIDIILCDPSCSGSGMKLHKSEGNEDENKCSLEKETPDENKERAFNLGKF